MADQYLIDSGKYLDMSVFIYLPGQVPLKDVELFGKFSQLCPQLTTVGTTGGNVILPQVRSSKMLTLEKIKIYQGNRSNNCIFNSSVSKFVPHHYHSNVSFSQQLDDCRNWQLHCYEPGDHFAKHTDGRKTSRHYATMLLFPPATLSFFTGGDLLLYIEETTPIKIQPSTFSFWTLVIFRLGIPHECTPVTSGRRFVLKSEMILPAEHDFFSNTTPGIPLFLKEEISVSKFHHKISSYQEKIAYYRAKIEALTNPDKPTTKVTNFLIKIKEGDLVILTTNEENLVGEEAQLWNAILNEYPYSSLKTIMATVNHGDSTEDHVFLEFSEDYEKLQCRKIHYWKSLNKHTPGQISDSRSEYNDNTYDYIEDVSIMVICVQKDKYI